MAQTNSRFNNSVRSDDPVKRPSGKNGPGKNGPGRSGPGGSGPGRSGPDGNGPDRSGPDGNGPDGSGPDGNGPDGNGQRDSSVPAVAKAMRIIRYLNKQTTSGAGLRELSDTLSITRSHCHNILRTLVADDWVAYDGGRRVYRLASGLIEDTSSALNGGLAYELHDVIVGLSREVELAAVLTRVEPDGTFIVIDKVDHAGDLGVSMPLGHRFPSDAPAQCKIRLAWLDDREVEAWLAAWTPVAYTRRSITSKARMGSELRLTRRRGYAISLGEYHVGVMSIGAPIFDRRGRVAMVLQCPGLEQAIKTRAPVIAEALLRATSACHEMSGGNPPGRKAA